ncbi:hypothetical protein BDV18DRAFT_68666 [Aspergillus unguis]
MPALYLEACPTMAFAYDHEAEFWGVLINPDKSPSPLLEQLCLGIAQVMTTFDNYAIPDITPERLATFYRKVGGNYDVLFLDTKPSALSFIYQRLGCYHSIQPSSDPYKPPSIPALQPHGFVRWQTIQLLLDPDEHVAYLQNAVERWDIFSPTGTLFPKTIPREAFPAEPDPEMIKWHETVSQKFEFDYWKRKFVQSPPDGGSPSGGYREFNGHGHAQKEPPKEDEFHQPRASGYRYSVPADAQTARRHQRRQSAEVPFTQANMHKPQAMPRRSAEFAGGFASPRAPSPPTWPKHSSTRRGRERKSYSRPVSPEVVHAHSSSDASSEDSGTPTQEFSPSRFDHHRNLSPPHSPHARRHSHEAYSRRPHRELSPDSQRRYAYRDAFNASARLYDSDSGRGPRQPRMYVDEVRQSRTPNPGPRPGPNPYREHVFSEPTSPVYGHAHPRPVHPRFVNVHPEPVPAPGPGQVPGPGSGPAYMVHPQPDLDANVMDDPRRSGYRGSLTPAPTGAPSFGRPRFASVGDFQPPRWSAHGHSHSHGHGHGPGRSVPPGIIEAEYGRWSSMYDR